MKLQVLGCAGGIGGREKYTSCLLLDNDILIDAGTGISDLSMSQLLAIDHVFLTHPHLDHVAGLAFLLDSVAGRRAEPVIVHATEAVIAALKTHLFNWLLWPDFGEIPDPANPILRWEPMAAGSCCELNGRMITSHPVEHGVAAVAYWVHDNRTGFLFSGDMTSSPALWERFSRERLLKTVFVECSFPDAEAELAAVSGHFCPRTLVADIGRMPYHVQFLITHLKPGQEKEIIQQLRIRDEKRQFKPLTRGEVFVF